MREDEAESATSTVGDGHRVREHTRNQWYPSLKGHKKITIGEHVTSNPTKIWQLVDPNGNVFDESRNRLHIDIALAVKGYAGREEGWHVRESWRSAHGGPQRRHKLNLLEDRHRVKKKRGLCVKALACQAGDTEEGIACPGCGKEFGRHPEWWTESARAD